MARPLAKSHGNRDLGSGGVRADVAGPAHDGGDAHAAFPEGHLLVKCWPVVGESFAAVAVGEDDECVGRVGAKIEAPASEKVYVPSTSAPQLAPPGLWNRTTVVPVPTWVRVAERSPIQVCDSELIVTLRLPVISRASAKIKSTLTPAGSLSGMLAPSALIWIIEAPKLETHSIVISKNIFMVGSFGVHKRNN